jgi:nucleoid DNA-binding protein
MLNVLYKYLLLNDHVGIPGIGNFTVARTAADFQGSTILPPRQQISFQPGSALTDKNFYHFLAGEKNISEVDAVRRFQDFAYELKKDIQANPFVEFAGLGSLRRNNTGELYFEPAIVADKYFPVLTPEQRTSHDSETYNVPEEMEREEVARKDRWWIWAIVLGLLAVAAIVYFYFQEPGF